MLPLTGGKKRMKAYVGVTDIEWYRQLSAESLAHDEVNFWFPSPTQGFRALRAGEPFLFKTHLVPVQSFRQRNLQLPRSTPMPLTGSQLLLSRVLYHKIQLSAL